MNKTYVRFLQKRIRALKQSLAAPGGTRHGIAQLTGLLCAYEVSLAKYRELHS